MLIIEIMCLSKCRKLCTLNISGWLRLSDLFSEIFVLWGTGGLGHLGTRAVDESLLSKTRVSNPWAQNTRVFELQWDYMLILLPKKHNKSNISESHLSCSLPIILQYMLVNHTK